MNQLWYYKNAKIKESKKELEIFIDFLKMQIDRNSLIAIR